MENGEEKGKHLGSFVWYEDFDFQKRKPLGVFHIKIVAKDEENARACRFYIPLIKTFLLTGTLDNENNDEGGEK